MKTRLQEALTSVESGAAEVRESRDREVALTEQVEHLQVLKGALAQDVEQLTLQQQRKEVEVSREARTGAIRRESDEQ